MTETITLYGDVRWTSPWVLAVWAALREKGIPFETRLLDLKKGEHREGDYPRLSLTGKVPALVHGGVWIGESLAILEYLEEVFGPPGHPRLYPDTPAARARDRQVLAWLRSDLFELRRCMPFEGIFLEMPAPEVTPKAREEAEQLLRVVATRISATRPEFTLADYELAFALRRLIRYGFDLSGHQEAVAYSESIWNRASVQSWAKQPRPPA